MPDLSDLSIKRTECSRCGAVWFNEQLFWATGAKGKEEDLAGLVCNMVNAPQCINPKKGVEGGDTWEKRRKFMDNMDEKIKNGGRPGWDAGMSFGDS
tara:strand:+ start:563 stop:853 length:291 start_codon:yes stop_codon:yes gene_type:complete